MAEEDKKGNIGQGDDKELPRIPGIDWNNLTVSDEYLAGWDIGYKHAHAESEAVRKTLTGWKPIHYLCAGFAAGWLVCYLWFVN